MWCRALCSHGFFGPVGRDALAASADCGPAPGFGISHSHIERWRAPAARRKPQIRAQMLHQWDERARADTRQIGNAGAVWRLSEICRRDPNPPPPSIRQRDNDVGGTAPRSSLQDGKPLSKQKMMRVGNRDVRHDPVKNRGTFPCSVIPPMPTPCSIASSTMPIGSTSPARACAEPGNPPERPEPVTLWTCRFAWTTPRRCPHAHSNRNRKHNRFKPRFQLTARLA